MKSQAIPEYLSIAFIFWFAVDELHTVRVNMVHNVDLVTMKVLLCCVLRHSHCVEGARVVFQLVGGVFLVCNLLLNCSDSFSSLVVVFDAKVFVLWLFLPIFPSRFQKSHRRLVF